MLLKRALFVLPAVAVLAALAAPLTATSSASPTVNCTGTQSTNVNGSLNVPAGATCTINPGVKISGGANQIGGSMSVSGNQNRVDISDNEKGIYPYSVGIGGSLSVSGNKVTTTSPYSPVVESNFIAGSAFCQAGTRMDGDGAHNTVKGSNSGCP